MAPVSVFSTDYDALLAGASAAGFEKCLYAVELIGGEMEQPLLTIGSGLTEEHRSDFLRRVRHDPLRRMLSRGEIPIGSTPIGYENHRTHLSIGRDHRLSASDTELLRWALAQGVRTGVNFRIRLSQSRYASINFYSAERRSKADLDTALPILFLIGHKLNERIEPHIPRGPEKLLSRREMECLDQIAQGFANREIADLLGLSIETIKEHVQSLFLKLRVNNRAQAVSRGHALAYLG